MEDITKEVFKALSTFVNEEKRLLLPRFFKTGKGEYGEGDKFIGVVVPDITTICQVRFPKLEKRLSNAFQKFMFVHCLLTILSLRQEKKTPATAPCL